MPTAPYDCYNAKKTRLETITDSETNQTQTFTYNNEGPAIKPVKPIPTTQGTA